MNILALDTSSSVAGAALFCDGKLVAEEYLDHLLTHSQVILPMAQRVLERGDKTMEELDCFAVNTGPGSFTGLRIGISAVNAMSAATGKGIVGIDALTCLAYHAQNYPDMVCPILDARGVQVYAAQFRACGAEPEMVGEPFAGALEDFLKGLASVRPCFLGDGAVVHRETLARMFPQAVFAPAHLTKARASSLAALAYERALRGETAHEVMPLYLRVPQAERMRNHA